ncbi:MAG: hypothetical protein EPN79_10870 [Burkholderiaceae bacterium]|nr:MAG: hypothetical protein EPN79_10870 [Burkholderiaceae bacterium]TBR76813.1 MAG: hypothetical protein EPN64_06205 [Burkholderiaceae bacterium]
MSEQPTPHGSTGFTPKQMDAIKRVIHSEGGMVAAFGVVGTGKSSSLAQLLIPLHSPGLTKG